MNQFWVYMLLCDNKSYYTGYTTNLEKRYQEHLKGSHKCKYTRIFKPLALAQSWQMPSKSQAMRVEYCIKQLSHQQKKQLVENPELILEFIPHAFCA